ncbi:MAG TPA: DUF1707 domain-containing protein [Actinomycetota bacterium]|nr:DUF1707 domain-containing protein [Actinomycetota bacterium]
MPPEANDHADQPRQPAAQPPDTAGQAPAPAQPPAERAAPAPGPPAPAPAPDATPRASDAERNHAIDRLRSAYVEGRLDQQEFDERSEAALKARTIGQLERLFDDLPDSFTHGQVRPYGAAGPVVRPGQGGTRLSLAVMSGVQRRGSWRVPVDSTAVAFMGGVELDLRTAVLSGPVTTITAVAFMGGIEIIVPPGIRVESSGFGFMGGWDNRASDDRLTPDAPVLRVRGVAIMGGVDIRTKEPRDPRGQLPTTGSA